MSVNKTKRNKCVEHKLNALHIEEKTNTIRIDTKKEARSAAMLINMPIAYRYKYGMTVRQKVNASELNGFDKKEAKSDKSPPIENVFFCK